MIDKAQEDSDREEKTKAEEYNHTAAQKRMRLPKIPMKESPHRGKGPTTHSSPNEQDSYRTPEPSHRPKPPKDTPETAATDRK
jgi:hypothetical protein